MDGTGCQEQYLINQGIIQNNTMTGGSLTSAVLQGKNTKHRARYVGLKSWSRGRVGREEADIRREEKTVTIDDNSLLVLP